MCSIHAERRAGGAGARVSRVQGTPYGFGLFEFDILLPADYPAKPPLVQLRTTGGGRMRFNPNLYNCGKVCLSLLGTWEGPSWDAATSTLLQVMTRVCPTAG